MKKLLLVFVVGSCLVFYGISTFFLPEQMSISQGIEINASSAKVFELVNNLHLQDSWSPWKELDPTIKNEFSGPERGVGAKLQWQSDNSGSGSMEIIEVVPGHIVQMALDFGSMGKANSSWTFVPGSKGSTKVSWSFVSASTKNPFARVANLLIKPSLEETYVKGLQNLKAAAENF